MARRRPRRRPRCERRPVIEAARHVGTEHRPHDFVLLDQDADRFGFVDAGLVAVAGRILAEARSCEVLRNADVIHDQAGRLVAEHPVHAGDGLHQAVPLHRLVDIHRVHARRVEAGQPHVAHDRPAATGPLASLARFGQLASRRAFGRLPICGCQARRIGGRPGHHHLDRARRRRRRCAMPAAVSRWRRRARRRCAGSCRRSSPCRRAPPSRSSKCVTRSSATRARRLSDADQRLDAGPLALEPCPARSGLVLGEVRDLRIDLRLLVLVELDPRQPALVIDRHRRAVLDRAADVVDVDVVAEDAGVFTSPCSMGVPVKPMNEALGKASRMYLAKP